MDAVMALYSEGNQELSEAIIASLSRAVFDGEHVGPAGLVQRSLARASYRILKWTTARRPEAKIRDRGHGACHNPLLELTGHPYARALLDASSRESESLVEGGDPMNGPYMMIVPEILKLATTWDRIFLNSVQGRDVQLRFIWETQATYEAGKRRLEKHGSVRMKAIAAGTGLSMIVAYDRLVREGYDPAQITVKITDREKTEIDKCHRILPKLSSTRSRTAGGERGFSAEIEDIFETEADADNSATYDVVTAVGILEYLPGFTCDTTERCHGLLQPREAATAEHVAATLGKMTTNAGALIVNTCRPHASTRILELFGKRFDYRRRENLSALLATANFRNPCLVGSANIYDIEVYEKGPS
jgi:hypothetical protein